MAAVAPLAHPEQWSDREKIQYLLDQFGLIFDQGYNRSGRPSGDHTPALPEIAHDPAIVELERCLLLLSMALPVPHKHVKAYRVSVEWKMGEKLRPRRLSSGKKVYVPLPAMIRLAPRWCDMKMIDRGETFLEREFDGPVYIPKPLWDGLTKPLGG